MLERDLKRSVMDWLKKQGYYFVKYHSGMGGSAGVPDLLGCVGGKFVAIELKVKPNTPTDLQLHNIQMIVNAGGFAKVCYEKQEVIDFIKEVV